MVKVISDWVGTGLTDAGLVCRFLERRVQPLYHYLERVDPTCEGSKDLPPEEVTRWMLEVFTADVSISTDGCPEAFSASQPPNLVCYLCFVIGALFLPLFVWFEQSLLHRGSVG